MTALVAAAPDGARLRVRLTPKAAADRIDGIGRDADASPMLFARVRAAPEKGAANEALERLLAKHFGLKPSSVHVAKGATARIKLVELQGATPSALEAQLSNLPEVA